MDACLEVFHDVGVGVVTLHAGKGVVHVAVVGLVGSDQLEQVLLVSMVVMFWALVWWLLLVATAVAERELSIIYSLRKGEKEQCKEGKEVKREASD